MKCDDCGNNEIDVIRAVDNTGKVRLESKSCLKCGSNNISDKQQLLTIELDNIDSVPRVFYKGEEITDKMHVKFEWETNTDNPTLGSPYIDIEHFVNDGKKTHSKTIRYNGFFKEDD